MVISIACYYILAILMIFGSFIPLIIYLRYGREPKIEYNAEYEVDLPTDDPPAIVNAICGSGLSKKMGEPDMNGFVATIMDLINRNYLLIKDMPSNDDDLNSSCSLFLEINPDYNPDTLWEFEVEVLNFLKEYEQDGIISMDMVSESLNYDNGANFFEYTYRNWKNEVKQALLTNGSLKEAFLEKGDKYIKIFGISGLIITIVIFFLAFPSSWGVTYVILFSIFFVFLMMKSKIVKIYGSIMLISVTMGLFGVFSNFSPAFKAIFYSAMIFGAVSIVSIMLPQKIAGQWTVYGREYYTKWHSFKKYIEDYSLIKDYSPKSVNVWNNYIVYATALGAAEEVRKAIKFSIPYDQLMGNDLCSFHYYNSPISLLKNAIDTALNRD